MFKDCKKQFIVGISAIELIVVTFIIVLITALAIPNYRHLIANYKATTLAADLTTALRLGKNEAMRRNLSVKICALAAAGSTSCNDAIGIWNFGWQVIVPSTNEIIRSFPKNNPTGVSQESATSITFLPNGLPTPNIVRFTITPNNCTQGQMLVYDITQPGQVLQTNSTPCI